MRSRVEGADSDFNSVEVNLGSNAEASSSTWSGAANEAIKRPKVTSVEKESRRGHGRPRCENLALPVAIGREPGADGLSQFIAKKSVKNDGTWRIEPDDNIGTNMVVTALQTDADLNSSELTQG